MAVIEGKTRYMLVKKLPVKSAVCMHKALIACLGVFPGRIEKTITYDNGTENAFRELTHKTLHTESYCAILITVGKRGHRKPYWHITELFS
jgi:IS30 family transposase